MKDKLTKTRIRVDYESMIIYLKLDGDFVRYIFSKKTNISARRNALAFLRSKKVDIQGVYYEMKEKGIRCDNDMTTVNSHPNSYQFDDEETLLEVKQRDARYDWMKVDK